MSANRGEFDSAAWEELHELFGRDGLAEMIDALQRDLPLQRQRLAAALAAEDRNALRHIAHSLRGVALQFGAAALAQSCGDIEQAVAGEAAVTAIGAATAAMLERQAALVRALQEALRGI